MITVSSCEGLRILLEVMLIEKASLNGGPLNVVSFIKYHQCLYLEAFLKLKSSMVVAPESKSGQATPPWNPATYSTIISTLSQWVE